MQNLKIDNINVGDGFEPIIIPEMGINHGGDLKIAFKIVDSAYRAGAKIIKHQTHIVDDEMSKLAKTIIPNNSQISIYNVMKQCALTEEQEFALAEYVRRKDMIFISTPFSREAVYRLERIGVSAYKIGSGEMNNLPLIDLISKIQKPIIISTGMNDIESIKRTIEIVKKNNCPYALLHCTNIYPTPFNLVRLNAMQELRQFNVPIGLSDHTINNNACIAAIAMGANIIERHFVDKKSRKGNDICCSMNEEELKSLIEAAQQIYQMRNGNKELIQEEQSTRNFAFATVVSTDNIYAGEKLTEDNIWVKRPGIGEIEASLYYNLLGKTAITNIEKDMHIKWEMIK